ncbi:hypothetical protein B0O80DRAFT_168093 [Mortierella sp. GBAus27b]|nr:hypothetical protein B0O80DRAFT_168093 [Mortierella sp. GBAus27b]
MGQYFLLLNLTKRQYIESPPGDISIKMWSILYNLWNKPFLSVVLVDPVDAAGSGTSNPRPGSWSGDRLVIIGDYSDDLPPFLTEAEEQELQPSDGNSPNLYRFARDNYANVGRLDFTSTEDELARLFPKGSKTHHLVLNLDRKEYLDPVKFKIPATYVGDFARIPHGVMQGLCSQICYSTGSGGGDVEAFLQGRWAGQRLAIREKDMVEDLDSWRDISMRVAEDVEKYVING